VVVSIVIKKIPLRANRKICIYHNEYIHQRKTILFLHDICGYARQWSGQWRHYRDQYNIVSYDLIGHGLSNHPNHRSAYNIQQLIFDAQAILEKYCSEYTIICSHGTGAFTSLILASLYPNQVQKMILINPKNYYLDKDNWHYLLPLWILNTFSFFGKKLLVHKLRIKEDLYLPRPVVLKNLAYTRANIPNIPFKNIWQDVLLIQSKNNYISPALATREYYENHIGNLSYKTISSTSHYLMRLHKDKVNYYCDLFIEKLNVKAFRNLVFEGAGVRGIAYTGAILSLEAMGVLDNIKNVAGASAGSFYAMFLALGCTASEIHQAILKLDYSSFVSSSGNFLTSSTRFLTDFGWYKTDVLFQWVSDFIEEKIGIPDITFRGLKKLGKKNLYLTGTNLSKSCAEIFCFANTPDMEVRDAVRISSSIPMYFKAYKLKTSEGEQIMVDGGLSCNYPIDIFDSTDFVDNPQNAQRVDYNNNRNDCFNHETLGFRLDPLHDPIREYYKPQEYKKISNILDYGKAFMKFVQSMSVKRHLHRNDWNRTVFINTHDIGSTDFSISKPDINRLIEEGKIGVKIHFAWRMSNEGLRFPQ
jgi:NTE family protein